MSTHRTLIVANRTAATPLLLDEVERRSAIRPTTFVLLVPDTPSLKHFDWTLSEALRSLRRAAGGPSGLRPVDVHGRGAAADPFESVRLALGEEDFDDVIISTLRPGRSVWLRQQLPARVRKLGLPVTVISQPKELRMSVQDVTSIGGFG